MRRYIVEQQTVGIKERRIMGRYPWLEHAFASSGMDLSGGCFLCAYFHFHLFSVVFPISSGLIWRRGRRVGNDRALR